MQPIGCYDQEKVPVKKNKPVHPRGSQPELSSTIPAPVTLNRTVSLVVYGSSEIVSCRDFGVLSLAA
jgi:hypothetical protein